MTVLVTGATGHVGSRIVRWLDENGDPRERVRRAGRAPGLDVRFDWTDPTTFGPALQDVSALYLLPLPGTADPEAVVVSFLNQARRAGVRRVALLSASAVPIGSPGLGMLGARLPEYVPEWAVLRPTWFASNFTGDHPQARSIRENDEIVSATGRGRVPFIDPGDIAAVAARVLTADAPPSNDLVLTGPEALSFDDVAAIVSELTGRVIRHRPATTTELSAIHQRHGLPESYADLLAEMDLPIAAGSEDRTTSTVEDITGIPPRSLKQFLTT
jgi:uncharacterized protein YbjT (DUF2867 family)